MSSDPQTTDQLDDLAVRIATAELRIKLDRRLGVETAQWIKDLAAQGENYADR